MILNDFQSISGPQVAEKALGIWRHQPTTRSTVQNCRDDLPLIISRLYTNITQAALMY